MGFILFISQHLIYLGFTLGLLFLLLRSERIPSNNFLLNLLLGSTFSVVIMIIFGLKDYTLVVIMGPWLCGIEGFMRKWALGALSFSVLGISYERVRYLPEVTQAASSQFPFWKVICLTWGVAGVLASPQFLAYEFVQSNSSDLPDNSAIELSLNLSSVDGDMEDLDRLGNESHILARGNYTSFCRKTPLLGQLWIKVMYEGLLCILFSFFPVGYNFYALYRLKFKVQYLFPITSLRRILGSNLYGKLKHIRHAFLYSSCFALFMIPHGLLTIWRSYTEDPYRILRNENVKNSNITAKNCLEGAFLILHPVLYLYTHHHSRFTSFFKTLGTAIRSCKRNGDGNDNSSDSGSNDEVMTVSTIPSEPSQQTSWYYEIM